ncbi:MAG: hypothetical protein CL484_04835 [Acidobacteria bacterium]|nr:hypothetical protein [Acidobacteriota bacterium]
MKFEVGDKVIYPNHGLGVVERIENRTIMGTTGGFYSLRMADSDTMVLVPIENVDGVGLRRAVGDEDVKKLFSLLGNGKIDNHQNWKGRFKDNSDKMRTGSIYDVVDVLKNLTLLAQSKNLSFREKRMLDRAKFLVVSEISEVMGDSAADIDQKVAKALDRCFSNRSRSMARAKLAKKKVAGKSGKAKTTRAKGKTTQTKAKTTRATAKAASAKTVKKKTATAKRVTTKSSPSRRTRAVRAS